MSRTGTLLPTVDDVTKFGRGPSVAGSVDGAMIVTSTVAVSVMPPPSVSV